MLDKHVARPPERATGTHYVCLLRLAISFQARIFLAEGAIEDVILLLLVIGSHCPFFPSADHKITHSGA